MQGLLGKKLGMTQVFDDKGAQVPVTVIEAGPCVVLQRKTKAIDGYEAIQLAFGEQKESRMSKPQLAPFNKINATPRRHVRELRPPYP